MKVSLNIDEDQELRAHIKDCVKGQVMAVVREGLGELVKEELSRKLSAASTPAFDLLLRNTVEKVVRDLVRGVVNPYNVDDFVRPFIVSIVMEIIVKKDWNKLVDDLAKEKIRAMINNGEAGRV